MSDKRPEMTAADVVEIVRLLEEDGIGVHVDGGWGVDALLGKQTRKHADLDIAMQHADVPRLRALLATLGFQQVPFPGTWECNFVLGDNRGRRIDVHSYTFDSERNNTFGVEYPAASLSGTGSIDGYPVKCISPGWLVRFHTGYKVDADDYHDVRALCDRFGIKLPDEYASFENHDKS